MALDAARLPLMLEMQVVLLEMLDLMGMEMLEMLDLMDLMGTRISDHAVPSSH
jgi:hypothetical protein